MKKYIMSLLLTAALAAAALVPAAFAAEGDAPAAETPAESGESITYVALGDSIAAGVGLPDIQYIPLSFGFDLEPNFEGYSSSCYVGVVAEMLGLDRQHAINLGLPALMTADLIDMIRDGAMPARNDASGAYYDYPQFQEYLRRADIISIQIGSNDALVPCVVGLGNATNWKSEQFADMLLAGKFRDLSDPDAVRLLWDSLSKFSLTWSETSATFQLLFSDMRKLCQVAYGTASANLAQVVQELHALNPDAQILLLGYTNPVPLLPSWSEFFRNMNRFEQQLAESDPLVTYVPIPKTQTASDAHPTPKGHRYIAQQIVNALQISAD